MTTTIAQQAQESLAIAGAVSPLFGPNAALAITVATNLLNAAVAASNDGQDITDAQLDNLLLADDLARADAARARQEVRTADIKARADRQTAGEIAQPPRV